MKLKDLLRLLQPEFPDRKADLESEVAIEFMDENVYPEDGEIRLLEIKTVEHNQSTAHKVHIVCGD